MDEFEMEEIERPEFEENREQEPKRTPFLLTLCILTYIGSGISFLSYLTLPLYKSQFTELTDVYSNLFKGNAMLQSEMTKMLSFQAAVPSWKYLLVALAYAGSVTGAALMMKLRKEGLHIYIISQILIFSLLSFLIGGMLKPSITSILWTFIFILLYFMQLKKSNVKF